MSRNETKAESIKHFKFLYQVRIGEVCHACKKTGELFNVKLGYFRTANISISCQCH